MAKMTAPLGTCGPQKKAKLGKGLKRRAPADKPHGEHMGKSMGGKKPPGRTA